MNRNIRISLVAALFGLLLAGCATANRDRMADIRQLDNLLQQASPTIRTELRLQAEHLEIGELVRLTITSQSGGYAYLFHLGTNEKKLSLLFPNAADNSNYLAPREVLMLPRDNWRMTANGPSGVGYMLALVTEKPLDLFKLQTDIRQANIHIDAPYGAALRALREISP